MIRLGQLLLVTVFAAAVAWLFLSWRVGEDPVFEPQSAPARGLALAKARGCLACHSIDGSPAIGPTWLGAHGAQRRFTDGSSAIADDGYLLEAMRNPGARVVEGYDNLMLPAGLTGEEMADIIALIRELTLTPTHH